MKLRLFHKLFLVFVTFSWLISSSALAAVASPAVLKAKQEAEAKGYIFEASRDEIVAKARKEGRLRALSSLDSQTMKALRDAFRADYPFLDVYIEELTGSDANQRFVLEMKTGRATGWDAVHISTDHYLEYPPHLKRFDVLGMARSGVLRIPLHLIDPGNRNIIAATSALQVVAFNNKLISVEKVPETWEGFLNPEFKGRKFLADIRPTEIAALVPGWGLEKTVDFARRLAQQQPIWVRGGSRTLASMIAGEYALFIGPNFHTVKRAQGKDLNRVLDVKVVDPVPTRLSDVTGVLNAAANPHAALLWMEFLTSPKGQKLADEHEPFGASVFVAGFAQEQATRGKKLSVVDWKHFTKMQEYQAKVVEAYGFPKAEKK